MHAGYSRDGGDAAAEGEITSSYYMDKSATYNASIQCL